MHNTSNSVFLKQASDWGVPLDYVSPIAVALAGQHFALPINL